MGSFRSAPDLEKHTVEKQGLGLNYAVTHMCGNSFTLIRLENLYGRRQLVSLASLR